MKLIFLTLFFSLQVNANVVLPYNAQTDSLCFVNGDSDLAKVGVPVLGSLGVKQGVCQGIAGVTAAFLENAKFNPLKTPLSTAQENHDLVQKLIILHRHNKRIVVEVPGSGNLHEFCQKNKRELMRASILYNAEIATNQILPVIDELFSLKKNQLNTQRMKEKLLAHLRSIETTLRNGRYPLMLYFRHVVMVTSFDEVMSASGDRNIVLAAYDSNEPDQIKKYWFSLEMNGLPKKENYMIWNLSY